VARELGMLGFNNTYALRGGWNEWYAADFPMENK
jgi:rhodanese-related sulfurtransferase